MERWRSWTLGEGVQEVCGEWIGQPMEGTNWRRGEEAVRNNGKSSAENDRELSY